MNYSPPLSSATLRRLEAVPDTPEQLDRAVLSVLHGMIGADWTVGEIAAEFSQPSYPLTRYAAELWGEVTLGNVRRLHSAAMEYRQNGVHAQRCRAARLTIADRWQGGTREGNSEYLVLLGLYRIAERVGSLAFTASARQVAEAAGCGGVSASGSSWQTAWHAAHRLAQLGLIELHAGQRDHKATSTDTGSRFRLLSPHRLSQTLRSLSLKRLSTTGLELWVLVERRYEDKPLDAALQHVCWEQRAGLGVACQRLWYLLQCHGELSAQRLSEATAINRSAVHKALKQLQRYGLAEHPQRGLWAATGDLSTLDEVAEALGIADRRQLRSAGFQRYREGRTSYVRQRQLDPMVERGLAAIQYPPDWPQTDDGRIIHPYTGEIMTLIPAEPSRTVLDPETGVVHVVTLTDDQIGSLASAATARFVALLGESAGDMSATPARAREGEIEANQTVLKAA